jgi:hypothetical protein
LSFVLINDYPVRFRQQPTALFEFTISVIVERYGANRRVCVGITGSSYVMKRERDITNGSVIKTVNIVKKRGTANSVIAESVNVIKQRKEATAPLKFPLSLSRSASVPLAVFVMASGI